MTDNTVATRFSELVINDDEITPTMLNPVTGHIIVTNQIGHKIIQLCDGHTTLGNIAETILDGYEGTSMNVVRADIEEFLERAAQFGLITLQEQAAETECQSVSTQA